MVCYHPIHAYRSRAGRNPKTGKWPIVFNIKNGYEDLSLDIPCGQCIGCRLERSRQWAVRCVHEASMNTVNSFLTLTYNNENLPVDRSLHKEDFQKFIKRLRKKFTGTKIRYFYCGEYGELLNRPHFHAIIFGFDFSDKELWSVRDDISLYRSSTLEKLWPYGFSTIGDVTFESTAYVARYVTKKVTGDEADSHYCGRLPEYCNMSLKPAIGRSFYEKYSSDIYPMDKCVVRNGLISRPPRYYDNIYDLTNHESFVKIKAKRKANAILHAEDNDIDRRYTKEVIKLGQFKKLVRPFEKEML